VYTVRSGLVRLERATAQGGRRILRIYGRGDAMGLEALLQRAYTATAIALGEVELCRIPASLIRELAARYPSLTPGLMERWQLALDGADEWLSELSVGSARYRGMRLLQKMMRYFDDGIVVLPGRSDIGAMLNVTLETASRMISDFKREGLLEGQGPRWFRVDAQRLAAAIAHEVASG
jgi:CRP-like cAMP-binding protein